MTRPDSSDSQTSPHAPVCPLRSRAAEIAAVAAVLVVAAALRFWAIDFGFPERTRPDEQYFVQAIQHFDRKGTLDPDWYFYPSFYMYVNLPVWRGYCFGKMLQGDESIADPNSRRMVFVGPEQVRRNHPHMEYLLGRIVTAVFGILTVLLVYILVRRSYGEVAAWTAAFLLAVNGLHTLNSHFYKSDITTTFFTIAALLCMARYVEQGRRGWNLSAAVTTGLAAATNYYGGFLVVPLFAAQFLVRKVAGDGDGQTPTSRGKQFGRSVGRALIRWETWTMPVIAGCIFAIASPYVFIRWNDFLPVFHRMLFADRQSLYDTMIRQVKFDDYGFQNSPLTYSLAFCLRYSMGLILSVVSVAGLVFMAVRRRAVDVLLLLFFVVHFLMIATGKAVFMRYYLSLVPILAIAAGALIAWIVKKVAERRPPLKWAALTAAIVVCAAGSAWTSIQQNRLLACEDTRAEARRWLEKNIPPRQPVGVPMDWWGEYYHYGKPSLPPGCVYVPVQPNEVRARNIRTLVVDDSLLRLYSPPERKAWSDWLERNAKLLHEITPYNRPIDDIRAVYDQLDAFYVPVARFKGIARPGPRIRVFSVKPSP